MSTMFCKYCGKELDERTQFCSSCGKQLAIPAKNASSICFYLILLVSPILLFLSRTIILLEQMGKSPELATYMLVLEIPFASIIFIVIALCLVKAKKIDSTCFENYDVITWSVFPLAVAVYTCYESFAMSRFGEVELRSYGIYTVTKDFFMLSSLWYYGCLLLFLLIKSGNDNIGKKAIIKVSIALVGWTFILLFFGCRTFLRILVVKPEMLEISYRLTFFSACFMWMRYLILLWFAILMGKRGIGFICGIVCSVGTFFVAGVASALFFRKRNSYICRFIRKYWLSHLWIGDFCCEFG